MDPIKKLIVFGNEEKDKDGNLQYTLQAPMRDASNRHALDLADNDRIIELTLDDEAGTTWMVDAESLHEIYPELNPALRPPGQRDAVSDETILPMYVSGESTDRGIVGKIAVKVLKLFAKKALEEVEEAADATVKRLVRNLENKHLEYGLSTSKPLTKRQLNNFIKEGAGLFEVDRDFNLYQTNNLPRNKDYFLFIHGTNSNTVAAFEDLRDSKVWNTIHDSGRTVLAFQHRTLTESPLENSWKLANLLPKGADLQIMSHSRGGIIGDILCRYSVHEGNPLKFSELHFQRMEEEEDRESDIEYMGLLNDLLPEKKITVSRFVRVACPAAGTVLASKRLDHLFNVLFNLMGGWFADLLKEVLTYVVDHKNKVSVLPGLEAQSTESPFMRILNDLSEESSIDGSSLAVISGNSNVSLSGNGLLAILTKLFFWKRNDLVVNTDSMYLGTRRNTKIQYFFDEGANVNHFKFFVNPASREAIDLALITEQGKSIPGFTSVDQYQVPASDRALLEYGELYPDPDLPTGDKPIVVMLPGIMGSNLTRDEKELWLQYWQIIKGGLMELDYVEADGIDATSVVKTSYHKLYKWLSSKYDVVVYPFDWRRPISDSAGDFNNKIKKLLKHGQPIKIIGHSMGGVLVRDFILAHNDTWQTLNASKDFRIIFLGSPLGGSHRILTVLFGKDAIINKLSKLDIVHSKKRLLHMFSQFPGILGLLPLTTEEGEDYADISTWQKMAEVFGRKNWPLPSSNRLNEFRKYRDNILARRDNIDYTNMVYIAGKDKSTPYGYYLDEIGARELYFLYTAEGDQSVTWELGIPQQLIDKNQVYFSRASHGALANEPELFAGIAEILETGATSRIGTHRPMVRGEEKKFITEPEVDFDLSAAGLNRSLFALGEGAAKDTQSAAPLHVTVSKGDLFYASYMVMAGHFLNDGILYAERAIDSYMNGELSDKHYLNIYPGEIGTSQIFHSSASSEFKGALIVGLGEPDALTSFQLSRSVEKAVLNYVMNNCSENKPSQELGISSLMMACGYGGLSIEGSIKAIIEGVQNANTELRSLDNAKYGTIKHLEFVELYANRSLHCMYTLHDIINTENSSYNILLAREDIKTLLGFQRRIPLDTGTNWWNRISVKYQKGTKESGKLDRLVYNTSTRAAREEENKNYSNLPAIQKFMEEISEQNQWSAKTARTLFQLLIPNDLKDKLKRKGNITWIVDKKTAAYPWELLLDDTKNAKPLSINAGMIRQLSISDYRTSIRRAENQQALVVADPIMDNFIGQLPGAKTEGKEVRKVLNEAGYPVKSQIGARSSEIVNELFSEHYSIVHLAGHGEFNPEEPEKSGMVIGNNIYLTVFDIAQMSVIPDLVFVNCCHLGISSMRDENLFKHRYRLAANIGTELIRMGVKAVIAAGWAVNDDAARDFANKFYKHMFNGDTFGDAVSKARKYIYDQYPNYNTWGAYQCYGDPFFKLKSHSGTAWKPSYIVVEEVEIDLENILNKLSMGRISPEKVLADLAKIEAGISVNKKDLRTAKVVEMIATIHKELGDYKSAVSHYDELFKMEKANFSFKSLEQYCNISIKHYLHMGLANPEDKEKNHRAIKGVIDSLNIIKSSGDTSERNSLLGSAFKRLAMLSGTKRERIDLYRKSRSFYNIAGKKKSASYSNINSIELSWLIYLNGSFKDAEQKEFHADSKEQGKKLHARVEELRKETAQDYNDMDYWDIVEIANIELCQMFFVNTAQLDAHWVGLKETFKRIWSKAGSPGKKILELEHLQFLIHGLRLAKGRPFKQDYDIYNRDESEANLENSLADLLSALKEARK